MRRWAIVAICVASTPATTVASEYDAGGRVGDYLNLVAARDSGQRLEIAGVCASACTVKLGARHACIHADASLHFHAATDADGHIDRLASLLMLQQYPRRLRAWAKRRGVVDSQAFTAMSGVEAIALGIPDCDARPRR